MKAVEPTLTPAELDSLLQSGTITEDLGTIGRDDTYGHGLIDALKAVQAVLPPAPDPQLLITPASLNFVSTVTSLSLNAEDAQATGSLSITDVVNSADGWLNVSAPGSGDGLGIYTITVDRTGRAEGIYTATITFTGSTGSSIIIPVSMVVGLTGGKGNTGFLWAKLTDPATDEHIQTVKANFSDGSYSYLFSDVKAGDYYVTAGTDSDNDQAICDAGEACGGYPILGQLDLITINDSSLGNIDFVSSFSFDLVPAPPPIESPVP